MHGARALVAAAAACALVTACNGDRTSATSTITPTPTAGAASTPAVDASRTPAPVSTGSRRYSRCHGAPFTLTSVDGISPMTGEHAFVVELTYTGAAACSLRGYPSAEFTTVGGAVVPFRTGDGTGPYVTHRPPRWVNLRPGGAVFMAVAKYRCDLRATSSATVALLRPPGGGDAVTVRFGRLTTFDDCSEGPSRIVYLSPVVSDERQLS